MHWLFLLYVYMCVVCVQIIMCIECVLLACVVCCVYVCVCVLHACVVVFVVCGCFCYMLHKLGREPERFDHVHIGMG